MKTVTEHIRDHLLTTCGYHKPNQMPSLEALRSSERSEEFETKRSNRKVIGAFRYGTIKPGSKSKGYERVDYMRQKLDLYVFDGNAEHLVDISNFAEIEYMEENHPDFHFEALDDKNHMEE